ncbi:MAG: hypothetical protein WBP93_08585, partial [Pyrinomonadaceae bacterium]
VEILKYSWSEYDLIAAQQIQAEVEDAMDPRPTRDPFGAPRRREPRTRSHPSNEAQTKGYQYRVRIRNSSNTKTIKSIDWDYVFIDPNNPKEVSHHRFHSDKKIEPGKDEQITVSSTSPPVQVLNVKAIDKPGKPTEQILVIKVEYTDGSTWERP